MLIDNEFLRFQKLNEDFIFRQIGASSQYFNQVEAYLNNEVPYRWIGRGGLVL